MKGRFWRIDAAARHGPEELIKAPMEYLSIIIHPRPIDTCPLAPISAERRGQSLAICSQSRAHR
jgi:hypothetical protein